MWLLTQKLIILTFNKEASKLVTKRKMDNKKTLNVAFDINKNYI